MLAKERRNIIQEMLRKDGAVTTAALMRRFSVSIETVRRDLLCMEDERLLQRVHGGAVSIGEMKSFQTLARRNEAFAAEKEALSHAAADLVQEGDTLGIDSGSTAIFFAEALKQRFSKLTVVTHSIDVFNILAKHADFSVILCGGHFFREENAFCGSLTLDMLDTLHMQKVFLCPSAVSLRYGICDYYTDLFAVQQKLLSCSDTVYILADSSKFEGRALLKLDEMRPEYVYVTDNGLSAELAGIYEENKIQIILGGS
ncbi:MAG: DeoR/GlpR transcriptional regulator [Clostridia bacterium]|nr:DeoR/GlpR transcriptional regulator [Clostridia bacterium]